MTAEALIQDLRSAGYALRFVAGKINVTSDVPLTDEARAAILANRSEVLALLEAEEAQRIQIVPAEAFIADLVDKGQLPPIAEPKATQADPDDDYAGPPMLLPSELRQLPHLAMVQRVRRVADWVECLDECGELFDLVNAGDVHAVALVRELRWAQRHRPDAVSSASHQPPIRPAWVPPLASLAHVAIGDMTPAEHWEAIGGSDVVGALSYGAEHSLRMAVIMGARGDPRTRAAGERDYHRLWRKFAQGDEA